MNQEESFFIHKYKPKKPDDYIYNRDIVNKIINFGKNGVLPNVIFHGPPGSGKHTIVLTFLSQLLTNNQELNMSIYNRSNFEYNVNYQDKNDITINIIKNNHYFELDADDYGYNDKKIFYNFISEISNSVDVSNQKYKIIIIKNADKLSSEAQYTLKRIMETNFKCFRIIFIVNNISLIDNAIKSRCIVIRIPGPTENDMHQIVQNISKKENININDKQISELISMSDMNMNKFLLFFQCAFINKKYEMPKDRLNIFFKDFINSIKKTKSTNIDQIRNKIYILLLHNTDIQELYNIITDEIIKEIKDVEIIKKLIKSAVYYNENCQLGYRDIYHFECYITYIINILNNNKIELINDII
tara:strand:- start:503 stop:1576 length:1074 start_codon:yes stop_codon:yes gene_type:complete